MTTRLRTRGALALLLVIGAAASTDAPGRAQTAPEFLLSPEGNHLWAYDTTTGDHQLVARAQNGTDPGASAPNGIARDINGQICVSPDGSTVVTGEDTVIAPSDAGDGGSSHDPRIAGWGVFSITGDAIGEIAITQVGKLAPEGGRGEGYAGDPDNYGCGFLDADRLFTTAIGNTLPGEPSNGQLFLWFGPFTAGYQEITLAEGGITFFVGEVDHCQIDVGLGTAGGIAVSESGDVYVASNRGADDGRPAGVVRYSGTWPTSFEQCTPEFLAANITETQVVPNLPIPGPGADPHAFTPSAVVLTPTGTMYVSSVFTGTIAEFGLDGGWIRDVYPTTPVAPPIPPVGVVGETPFGMALAADGSLFVADLGIVGAGPEAGQGSVLRVDPSVIAGPTGETVRSNLTFPDGLGIYQPVATGGPPGEPTGTTAEALTTSAAARSTGALPATGGEPVLAPGAALLLLALAARRTRSASRPSR